VRMPMRMRMAMISIGAGFRLERRLLDSDIQPQPAQHVIQHMIVLLRIIVSLDYSSTSSQ